MCWLRKIVGSQDFCGTRAERDSGDSWVKLQLRKLLREIAGPGWLLSKGFWLKLNWDCGRYYYYKFSSQILSQIGTNSQTSRFYFLPEGTYFVFDPSYPDSGYELNFIRLHVDTSMWIWSKSITSEPTYTSTLKHY